MDHRDYAPSPVIRLLAPALALALATYFLSDAPPGPVRSDSSPAAVEAADDARRRSGAPAAEKAVNVQPHPADTAPDQRP